jgi:DNA polymerase sigma
MVNSSLVNTYASYDTRFIKLALVIKTWNKARFPEKMKRLNSFSLYLMLIAFLQDKGILPNLQALAPK